MMWYTHLVFSLLCGILFLDVSAVSHPWIFLVLVVLFGFFPDIDESKSKIGRKLPGISHIIKFIFGHRGLFHSIWIPIVVLIITFIFGVSFIGWAFLVGYLAHLIGDALTVGGVKFLYPLKLQIKGFFKTGKLFEKILFIILLILDIYLVLGLL
jgi:inner membrane protein